MNFEIIQRRAKADWEALENSGIATIRIGTATCGRAAGASATVEAFREEFNKSNIDANIIEVGCAGLCYAEPLVIISKPDHPRICYRNISAETAPELIKKYILADEPCSDLILGILETENEKGFHIHELPRFKYETRSILRRCGYINPENINHYIANDGYSGLNKALKMTPYEILTQVKKAGLRGLGGAGFPTAKKWESCRNASSDRKYVICNADEGDPGAFMDRVILESDPHQVIEGMVIAGYAVGTPYGYIYIRSEYPLAVERLRIAVEQARGLGFLGDNILGTGFNFDIEIFLGAGAFVCGEASALMYSIEGKRGMPRVRPPRSVEAGLWSKPTVLNNVKTFANIPLILAKGGDWFAQIGTERSKGTAVFALAGKILNTGLAEVPMGTSLRRLIFDIGGGIRGGKRFKSVQIGGPSGACLPESLLDTPIDFDSLTDAGAMMGSGGLIVMDEDDCVVDTGHFFLDFTQRESCGKCTMCRLGTRQMLDILQDITKGNGKLEDLDLLVELGDDIKVGSLCGLGRTAPNPILATIRYFRGEYEDHILRKRCPALVCTQLLVYYILPEKCSRFCNFCLSVCSTKAITTDENGLKIIDQEKCIKCGICKDVCPPQYNAVVRLSPPRVPFRIRR